MKKKTFILIVFILIIVMAVGYYFFNKNNSEENNVNNTAQTQSNEDTNNENKNILVLYFSMTGNTQTVAEMIHNQVGGDILRLETVQEYPTDYDELVDYAQNEQSENARPQLKTSIENISNYDVIFLGYPNWWSDMPMPVYSFLDEYDLSGKTIAPFITHGGSGLSSTPEKIKQEEPSATVTNGLAVYGDDVDSSNTDVTNWLNEIGVSL